MVEEALADVLRFEKDDIAASLGIKPEEDGDWTHDEAVRIIEECDRLYRASVIERILPLS